MGLFSNPNCPHCGGELQETGYCAPYPSWRCPQCIRRNREKTKQETELDDLRARVAELEET